MLTMTFKHNPLLFCTRGKSLCSLRAIVTETEAKLPVCKAALQVLLALYTGLLFAHLAGKHQFDFASVLTSRSEGGKRNITHLCILNWREIR